MYSVNAIANSRHSAIALLNHTRDRTTRSVIALSKPVWTLGFILNPAYAISDRTNSVEQNCQR
ncbi:MAG: hypothetical protein ACYTXC_04320 [Nostoc sp.]